MNLLNTAFRIQLPVGIVAVLSVATFAFAAGGQGGEAQETGIAAPVPRMVGAGAPSTVPPPLAPGKAPDQPTVYSPVLSYYFVPGYAFTPDGSPVPYVRQVVGCVNQMPRDIGFSAPVSLPQGSQVVSITLYSYDTAVTTTIGNAYFILSDGKGLAGYTVSAGSQPNTAGYQQNDSAQNNPATIDYQNYNYYVQWRTSGASDSPYLSLCGVRVAYYAPAGATYLPIIGR